MSENVRAFFSLIYLHSSSPASTSAIVVLMLIPAGLTYGRGDAYRGTDGPRRVYPINSVMTRSSSHIRRDLVAWIGHLPRECLTIPNATDVSTAAPSLTPYPSSPLPLAAPYTFCILAR